MSSAFRIQLPSISPLRQYWGSVWQKATMIWWEQDGLDLGQEETEPEKNTYTDTETDIERERDDDTERA